MEQTTSPKMEIIQDIIAQISIEKDKYGMEDKEQITQSQLPRAGSNYLNVPCIDQGAGTQKCWAVSMQSVGRFFGVYRSIDQLYEAVGVPKYNGCDDTNKIAYVFTSDMGRSVSHYRYLTYSSLKNAINAGRPIFAGATDVTNTVGHAVVLRGYSEGTTTKLFSYMNPTGGSYWSANMSVDGQFPIINASGSAWGYMDDYITVS